jgi:hypothetical protein
MQSCWTETQVTTGKAIVEIADQVLEENLHIGSLSPINKEGMPAILVVGDAPRDKRGSGRKKDSLSGCFVFNSNWSKLTVGLLEPMSQTCIKCSKGIDHDCL